jgi:hypothetical protein
MGFIPTMLLASQLVWNQKVPDPQQVTGLVPVVELEKSSKTICTVFFDSEMSDAVATLSEQAEELGQVEQVLRELRPDEGVQQPSTRDFRHNYRRYDVLG